MKRAFVLVLMLLFSSVLTAEAQVASKRTQTISPDVEFRALDGDTPIRMSAYENQTFVIVAWASWCPPCRLALTELTKLKRQSFAKTPFPVIALSIENPSSAEGDLRQIIDVVNYTGPAGWINEKDPLLEGRTSLPQILIVKNLKVLKRFIGWHPKNVNEARSVLTAALKTSR